MSHPLPKRDAIVAVPIAQQISRCFVPQEGVNDLLGGPHGGGVLGDVDMHHAAPFMGQDQQHEEHFVGYCRHDKEIQGHQVLHVVLQKGFPCRGRWPFRWDTILLHHRFSDVNAQLTQLAHDAWRAPDRIGLPYRADKIADIFVNGRTAQLTTLAQSPPMVAKALALPGDHGMRLDERQNAVR
jgi:hypothetical protein